MEQMSQSPNEASPMQQQKNDEITDIQLKFCSTLLNKLKRNPNAGPFLKPVDPIALGIPDYPEKIKHPMDISTIKQKLDQKVYSSPEEFNSDMHLMFNNCYLYNGPESVVYGMGKDLQKAYDNLYADLPSEYKKKKVEPPISSPLKPRRVLRSPEAMNPEDANFCYEVLLELEKPKHRKCTRLFMYPVKEEEAPGYFSIITQPMDLSTVRQKLEQKKYSTVQDFVSDLNLIVDNCHKFNAPDTEVYSCGEELSKIIQALVHRSKDVEGRIAEIRKKIASLNQELKSLEQQTTKCVFTLADREKIGKSIIQMSKLQTEKIAEIVHRHCAYEYVDNDEIEINLQTMPDDVVAEIDEYIQKIKNGDGDDVSSASED